MNPLIIVLTIKGFLKWAFSKDPKIARERKQVEDWYEKDVRGALIEGYEAKGTEWIKIDIPQSKYYSFWSSMVSIVVPMAFVFILIDARNIPDTYAWLICLPMPAELFCMYKLYRSRAHRATVHVYQGTRTIVPKPRPVNERLYWRVLTIFLIAFGTLLTWAFVSDYRTNHPPKYHSVMERVYGDR